MSFLSLLLRHLANKIAVVWRVFGKLGIRTVMLVYKYKIENIK